MLAKYFTISASDVKPDPLGKIGKLTVGAGSQLEVDCDVYASYGARLLRPAGWSTVGYAETLRRWRANFEPATAQLGALGYKVAGDRRRRGGCARG